MSDAQKLKIFEVNTKCFLCKRTQFYNRFQDLRDEALARAAAQEKIATDAQKARHKALADAEAFEMAANRYRPEKEQVSMPTAPPSEAPNLPGSYDKSTGAGKYQMTQSSMC